MIREKVKFPLALPTMPRFVYKRNRTCEIKLVDEEVRKVGGDFGPRVKRIKLD
jgi:hypothetical protein